jgi:hypothetical protein
LAKIKNVRISQLRSYGNHHNFTLSVDIEIEDGEDVSKVVEEKSKWLSEMVDSEVTALEIADRLKQEHPVEPIDKDFTSTVSLLGSVLSKPLSDVQ